jgi:hypothetical protein
MGTVDGEHLKLIARDAAYPARRIYSLSIGWHDHGIAKSRHPGLALRKAADVSEAHPGKIAIRAAAGNGGKKKTRNRQSQYDGSDSIE